MHGICQAVAGGDTERLLIKCVVGCGIGGVGDVGVLRCCLLTECFVSKFKLKSAATVATGEPQQRAAEGVQFSASVFCEFARHVAQSVRYRNLHLTCRGADDRICGIEYKV